MSTGIVLIAIIVIVVVAYFLIGNKFTSNNVEGAKTDAKRFARLLIAGVRLDEDYRVQKGLKNNNLYELLRYKIEDARKIYQKRFATPEFEKFFEDALIEVLADGDKDKLGLEYNQRSK